MVPSPSIEASTPWGVRIGNLVPLVISLFLASSVFWAPLTKTTASIYAIAMTVFFTYWVLRSYSVAIAVWIGLRRIRKWERTDWAAKFAAWRDERPTERAGIEAWDWARHIVIIPNYKEDETSLSRTVEAITDQVNAKQVIVILAMEAREPGANDKAARLVEKYSEKLGGMFATFHPYGLPGDTPGKGSNEAWAAREAFSRLIEDGGDDIRRYTITSCDADALFHPRHFSALNYMFLTARDRYRTFWQPTIFNSNNIWDTPAPLRIPDGLSGINRTANLVLPMSLKFPTSCYALSWEMLHTVDYWDEEVIPEDWHIYMKCCYSLGDRVHVEALFLPLGNDCVLTENYTKTLFAHYEQSKRHAWGASDIPYAWRAAFSKDRKCSLGRGVLIAFTVTKVHTFWFAQWYIVSLGIMIPTKLAAMGISPMPHWWTHKAFQVPGPGWHPENAMTWDGWANIGTKAGVIEPWMWLNLVGLLVALCIIPLFVMIAFEGRTRPPRPAHVKAHHLVFQYAMWPAMMIITFFWASLPALHAQWRLATGQGLIYIVAEKNRRSAPVALVLQTADVPAAPSTLQENA